MARQHIVTLITDFGREDEYVGVLKGVMLCHCPHVEMVDISHDIPPQNIFAAGRLLSRSYNYFPRDTVHLAIVDPGVGSQRRLLAIKTSQYTFVGPDNGLFTPILKEETILDIRELTEKSYFLKYVSTTFHGRDIMAPVAAHLAAGLAIEKTGDRVDFGSCITLPGPFAKTTGDRLSGTVVSIDHFGNLCTNISREDIVNFSGQDNIEIQIGKYRIDSILNSYNEGEREIPIAVYDSHNFLEITVNSGNAGKLLAISTGEAVTVTKKQTTPCS